jgi:hypothetical protein
MANTATLHRGRVLTQPSLPLITTAPPESFDASGCSCHSCGVWQQWGKDVNAKNMFVVLSLHPVPRCPTIKFVGMQDQISTRCLAHAHNLHTEVRKKKVTKKATKATLHGTSVLCRQISIPRLTSDRCHTRYTPLRSAIEFQEVFERYQI